jgi:hypothetical protein
MFGRCGYSASCTSRKELLVCQLHCGKFLPFGLLHLEGSRAQCEAPSLLCTAGVVGLLLQVVPPTVELALRPLLLQRSQSEVLCEPFPLLRAAL